MVDRAGDAAGLEVAARLDDRPGNPAVTPDGRLLLSPHPFPYGEPSPYRVVEVLEDGSTRPFPDEDWSTAPDETGVGLNDVIRVQSDRGGIVWILDMGGEDLSVSPPKLVAWDTRHDELHRVIHIPPHARRPNSFQQDLAIDEVRGAIFIADVGRGNLFGPSDPAIVEGRQVRGLNPDGEPEEPKLGLDPIVIDPRNEWVY